MDSKAALEAPADEVLALATYENHDADIPTNLGALPCPEQDRFSHKDSDFSKDIDIEKGQVSRPESQLSREGPEKEEKITIETEEDPNVVFWDGPDDPQNPLNWSDFRKWGSVAVISAITLLTPLASSMFAPGVPELMAEFESTNTALAGFVVSVFVLGFAFGPLIIAPLSEMYGRMPLYHICNVLFIVFTIACGLSTNINMFIVFRFFQGTFGASPLALGGGTIADLIHREHRGTAMALWMTGPTAGPVIGPIAGGFITQAKGWRWNFWIIAIISSGFAIASIFLIRETYAPALLARKTRRLRKETGNPHLRSKLDTGLTPKDLFWFSIIRPTKMLLFSPIVFFASLYLAITYAYLYILFTTFTEVFTHVYGWSRGISGLSFAGLGVGCIIGQFYGTYMANKIYMRHIAKGDAKPEHRLPMIVPGALLIPIGLFWYGWSVQYRIHWIMPEIGVAFVGCGLMWTFMPLSTYLVDTFAMYAASAMAASTVLRSIFAAFIPLGGQKMYAALGYGWGNSLLGFIAIVFAASPFVFLRYGERIRTKYTVKL